MKKLIAILAVFAFLGAALFAQDEGSWSIGGDGRIGTRIDALPLFEDGSNPQAKHATTTGRYWGDGFDNVRANIDLKYTKGGFSTTLGFNQQGKIGASLAYSGNNVNFEASQDLIDMLFGRGGLASTGASTNAGTQRGKIWGNYKFVDVMNGLLVEVAVDGRDDPGLWNTGSFFDADGGNPPSNHDTIKAFTSGDYGNGKDYLILDLSPMAGLNVGVKLPNLFNNNTAAPRDFMDASLRHVVFGVKYASGDLGVAAQFGLNGYMGYSGSNRLFIGASYKINGQMSVQFDFKGEFGRIRGASVIIDDSDPTDIIRSPAINTVNWDDLKSGDFDKGLTFTDLADLRFGVQFAYDASPLYARMRVIYFNEVNTYGRGYPIHDPKTGNTMVLGWPSKDPVADPGTLLAFPGVGIVGGKVRINPLVQYKVIPESLMVELGATFDLPLGGFTWFNKPIDKDFIKDTVYGGTLPDGYEVPAPSIRYAFTPAVYFNFLGNGAGDNPGTGMRFRWNVEGYAIANKHVNNNFDITFHWSF